KSTRCRNRGGTRSTNEIRQRRAKAADADVPAGTAPAGPDRASGSFKAALAAEFYRDGASKVELGRRHGSSRFQVARLLEEAREEGIVRHQIVDPVDVGTPGR